LNCRICNGDKFEIIFNEKIRTGGAESQYNTNAQVFKCQHCSVEMLSIDKSFNHDYWGEKVDSISRENIYNKYDWEQELWLSKIGLNTFRDKIVLDFGCGHGIFLDLLQNIASMTYGVEKNKDIFDDFYRGKKHQIFYNLEQMDNNSVDIIVAFDVIEHLEAPLEILKEMYRVLNPNGKVYIGVPNQCDFLKSIEKEYLKFFYHEAHVLYFNEKSLSSLIANINFKINNIQYLHKYNIYNMINWIKDQKPSGNPNVNQPFDKYFDTIYKSYLEDRKISSHILISANK